MDSYATSTVRSARSSTELSSAPSFESLKSASSRRQVSYSHMLYNLPVERKDSIPISERHFVSRFSDCSSSASSSCESLHAPEAQSLRGSVASTVSTTPSFLAASSRSSSRRTSRSTSSRYADDHYPLITNITTTTRSPNASIMDMAHTYNTYIRAINSCYNNALVIDDDEVPDFIFFAQTLFNILSQHLKIDHQYLVPLLHKPILHPRVAARRSVSIHDNLTFRSSFHAWATYIHDPVTEQFFSGEELQAYMSTFAPLLVQHLHDAVYSLNTLVDQETLMPEHMTKIWSHMEQTRTASLDLYTDVALLIGCHDRHFTINGQRAEQRFPQLPIGTTTMVKKWHSRRHEGAWKFCSSDFSGKRRLLHA